MMTELLSQRIDAVLNLIEYCLITESEKGNVPAGVHERIVTASNQLFDARELLGSGNDN